MVELPIIVTQLFPEMEKPPTQHQPYSCSEGVKLEQKSKGAAGIRGWMIQYSHFEKQVLRFLKLKATSTLDPVFYFSKLTHILKVGSIFLPEL